MFRLVPKGRDCADHEWYRHAGDMWHCYHCKAEQVAG
jgi:ribosomal protein L37AE/L43A